MSTARDYRIILAGLRDGSSRSRHAFATTLARVPGWSEEHANALLDRVPVVVHRTGDAEEARRTCAFLTEAGGDARIDEAGAIAAPPPDADATPARAIDACAAAAPAAPVVRSAPPREPARAPAPTTAVASSLGTVPFAPRAPSAHPPSVRTPPVRSAPAYAPRVVHDDAPAGWAPGPEARLAASGIIAVGLLSDVIQAVHQGGISGSFAFGMLIAAALAYGIYGGSTAARVIMTVLGGIAILGLLLLKGLLAGASPDKLPPGVGATLGSLHGVITATIVVIALVLALLWGHGSKTKALLLGIPALGLHAWMLYASLAIAAPAASVQAASAKPPEVQELERAAALASTDTRAAILAAEPIEEQARKTGNRELLADALTVLGAAHAAAGRVDMGLDKLREALANRPGDADIQGLIDKIEQAQRAQAEADTRALQARARGPSAPVLFPR
jgi:hypothetical protein